MHPYSELKNKQMIKNKIKMKMVAAPARSLLRQ
jgi:hypothetical protein